VRAQKERGEVILNVRYNETTRKARYNINADTRPIEATDVLVTELTKAVAGLSVGVTAIPQRSAFNVAPARTGRPVIAPANDGMFLGGNERNQRVLLAKGLQRGILDDGQKRRFYLAGQFDEDTTEDKRIRDELAGL